MRTMGKALAVLMLAASFMSWTGSMATAADPVYKIGVTPQWVGWSGYHVADAKGFWDKRGVNVTVCPIETDKENLDAMKSGMLDLGIFMTGALVDAHQEGEDVVVIAETDWSDGGDKIIVKKGIDLKEMKGKAIGVYLNQTCVTYFLDKYLASEGLKLSDFKIVEIEDDVALTDKFISGVLPVIVTYDPEGMRAEKEGNGEAIATTATYPGSMPCGLAMRKDRLQSIPKEDLKNIFLGYTDAVTWLKDPANRDEFHEILNTVTFKDDDSAPYSEADLQEMMDAVKIHDKQALLEQNKEGGGLEIFLGNAGQFLKENDGLEKEFEPTELYDTSILIESIQAD